MTKTKLGLLVSVEAARKLKAAAAAHGVSQGELLERGITLMVENALSSASPARRAALVALLEAETQEAP